MVRIQAIQGNQISPRGRFFVARWGVGALFIETMTKKTREAITTSLVIVAVVAAIIALWVYPLNQAGKIISRKSGGTPGTAGGPFVSSAETLTVVSEDNQKMACLLFKTPNARGTFILAHGLFADRTSQLAKAQALVEAGFAVMIYDQRAYGLSEGKYRSGGYYETDDLQEIISWLDLRNLLVHPAIVWGEDHGASAAVRAWEQEVRIDYVVAENPVADGRDWQRRVVQHDKLSAPDLLLPIIWWWMKQKSGYEISMEETDLSDQFGWALTNKPGKLLAIACGINDKPDNTALEELKSFGNEWLILPCPDGTLFEKHRAALLSAIMTMIGH